MQECRLKVPGCQPIFQEGVCCPVKYNCDGVQIDGVGKPGLISSSPSPPTTTTAVAPSSGGCMHKGKWIQEGDLIETEDPCEHCYCLNGDAICGIHRCMEALEGDAENCKPTPTPPGHCCPTSYECGEFKVAKQTMQSLVSLQCPMMCRSLQRAWTR